jgi:hypothetical protein
LKSPVLSERACRQAALKRIEHILKLRFGHGYVARVLFLSWDNGDLANGLVGKAYAALLPLAPAG